MPCVGVARWTLREVLGFARQPIGAGSPFPRHHLAKVGDRRDGGTDVGQLPGIGACAVPHVRGAGRPLVFLLVPEPQAAAGLGDSLAGAAALVRRPPRPVTLVAAPAADGA